MTDHSERRATRRGYYAVPTTLTVVNVFFGFTAILLAIRGTQETILGNLTGATEAYQLACWSLLAAAIFDTFDGMVARLMNATSDFGREYDSLADVITFGTAPAVLVYCWALHLWGKLGGGIAFLFLVGGSLRLARFNIQTTKTDHRYFIGLPIPAAALTIAAVIFFDPAPVRDKRFAAVILILTLGLALAMVSTLRYRSQKYTSIARERSRSILLLVAMMLVVLYRWPQEFFFYSSLGYLLSGPALKVWSLRRKPGGESGEAPSAEVPGMIYEQDQAPEEDEPVSGGSGPS